MAKWAVLICMIYYLAGATGLPAVACPAPGFDTQGSQAGGFNLTWYTQSTWHIQYQMPISYLPADYERCVTATYTRLDKPTLLGYEIHVDNHAENKDGKPLGPITQICAKVINETAGKLEVWMLL